MAVQGLQDKVPEERGKIIRDNRLGLFCLLHDVDEICYSKVNKTKPICEEAGCKGQHIKWLLEMLKEIPPDSGKAEGTTKSGHNIEVQGLRGVGVDGLLGHTVPAGRLLLQLDRWRDGGCCP